VKRFGTVTGLRHQLQCILLGISRLKRLIGREVLSFRVKVLKHFF